MNYRRITELVGKYLNLSEIYTYFCLAIKSDFTNLESKVKQDTLAKYITDNGYTSKDKRESRTIMNHIKKFKDVGLLSIDTTVSSGNKEITKQNCYKLTDLHYVLIDEKLVKLQCSNELKGFLVLLKTMCLNGTNMCKFSIREMAERTNIPKSTIGKYLKLAEEAGYIKRDDSIHLLDSNIFIVTKESVLAKVKSIYPECLTDDDLLAGRILQ